MTRVMVAQGRALRAESYPELFTKTSTVTADI